MIESQYKYYVEKLEIYEDVAEFYTPGNNCIFFINGRSYSSICIKRLTYNLSVGYLYINLEGASDFHREVYNLIKEFNIGKLDLEFSDRHLENEMMVDSYFLDLSRACKELALERIHNITPNALHQIYKMMMEGSTKLRTVKVDEADNQVTPFLELLGITFRDTRFFTNRDIEGFEYRYNDELHSGHVFDGNLEIDLHHYVDDYDEDIPLWKSGIFLLKLHDSNESLHEAKKILRHYGFACINFAHE